MLCRNRARRNALLKTAVRPFLGFAQEEKEKPARYSKYSLLRDDARDGRARLQAEPDSTEAGDDESVGGHRVGEASKEADDCRQDLKGPEPERPRGDKDFACNHSAMIFSYIIISTYCGRNFLYAPLLYESHRLICPALKSRAVHRTHASGLASTYATLAKSLPLPIWK